MNANDLPRAPEPPVAHPLARELAQIVSLRRPARVLVVGVGSGRNLPVLLAADARVDAIEEDAARLRDVAARYPGANLRAAAYCGPYPFARDYAGALSTHALLHGRRAAVAAAIAAIGALLLPGGHFFATLGSTRDPRYGRGVRTEEHTFAATDGSEAGVEHGFFDEAALYDLFSGFELAAPQLTSAAETAGRWAHTAAEASTLVHWFVHARARA